MQVPEKASAGSRQTPTLPAGGREGKAEWNPTEPITGGHFV